MAIDAVVTLKLYSGLAAQALKVDQAAAYAVWTLARALDHAGSGAIFDADLRAACAGLADWDDRKYRRARADAIALGVMTLAGDRLYLASLEKTAYKLGARRIGHTPIGVDVRTLSKVKSWRAALRDAFLAGQRPNPISQKTIEVATGLTPRTQYAYSRMNRRAVNVIHNYARLEKHVDPKHVKGIRESIPGAYYKDGGLWTTLPNTYEISEDHYSRLQPGRTHKAQTDLGAMHDTSSDLKTLVIDAAGQGSTIRSARMYYDDRRAAFKAMKREGKGKVTLPDQLYVLGKQRKASNGRTLFKLWFAYNRTATD